MKIKKYVVKSIDEALSAIKRDLGGDAYILSQKKIVQKGALNLGNVEMLEVTAAIESEAVKEEKDRLGASLLARKYGQPPAAARTTAPAPTPAPVGAAPGDDPRQRERYFSQLAEIKDELQPLKQEMERIRQQMTRRGGDGDEPLLRGVFQDLFGELIDNGVESTLARKMIQTLQYQSEPGQMNDGEWLRRKLFQVLVASLPAPAPLKVGGGRRKVVALVGPTGVGKTTTIAKLASYYKLVEGRKVALITIDSYRIGAEAHLKTYADILELPFQAVYTREDLEYRLGRLQEYDLVFIDTAGRGARDREGIAAVQQMLDAVPTAEREVLLLLSAATKTSDMEMIYRKFSILSPDKLVYSKIDETCTLGNLFNLQARVQTPAAYLTTGQRVPEDIAVASPTRLARLVLEGNEKGEAA